MDTENQQPEPRDTQSGSPDQREVMEQTMAEAHQYGRRLVDACSMIGDCFQQGQQQQGIAVLSQLIEGMEWFSQAVYLTRPLHAENEIVIEFQRLPGTLRPLVEAMQNKDYTLLADLLRHEVQPMLRDWSEELGKCRGAAEAAG